MTRSESVNELAAALALAQAAMGHAKKDSENPHYRSRYADLAAIWDACRAALTSHGLAVVQAPRLMSAGDGVWMVEVETTLLHGSGQFLSDVLAVPVTPASAQVVGSAITYARRYALAGFVGVAPAGEDDDAEASSAPPVRERRPVPTPAPALESAPAGAMDTATVKVLGIVKRILPSGKEKYVISADDLKAYGTFALELATEAKRAQEAAAPIEIVYKSTRYGLEVVTLREAGSEPPL